MSDSSRYRLSPLARADLEEIWLYTLKRWSVEQADRYHNDIMETLDALAEGTRTGRAADDIRQGYLKCAVGSRLIFYRRSERFLDVIRILHQRMEASRHL